MKVQQKDKTKTGTHQAKQIKHPHAMQEVAHAKHEINFSTRQLRNGNISTVRDESAHPHERKVYQPNHDAEYYIHTDAINGHVLDHPGKDSHSKHLATIWWHDAKWEITESSILKISKDGLIFQLGPNSHRMACCVLVPFLRNDNASDAA